MHEIAQSVDVSAEAWAGSRSISGRRPQANTLALRGSIGWAVKALTNGPRASSEEATLAKLRELHPSAAELDDDAAVR